MTRIHEFEKRFIARVLGCCDGSLTKTADTLGIHRNTLSRKMGEVQDQETSIRRHGGRRPCTGHSTHPARPSPPCLPRPPA